MIRDLVCSNASEIRSTLSGNLRCPSECETRPAPPAGVFALSRTVYPACLPSLVQRQVTMLVALADRLNPTSRRATLQPPLAYCVTEFGRLFVRRAGLFAEVSE